RLGNAEDCAGAALLLCSEAGSYINGSNQFIDGGLRL
ncbi:MAG: SDR family oxidoreductase, partial [Opitutales bacterium]|nr:SDR family oxidoreductase [Opitutales bacterium]